MALPVTGSAIFSSFNSVLAWCNGSQIGHDCNIPVKVVQHVKRSEPAATEQTVAHEIHGPVSINGGGYAQWLRESWREPLLALSSFIQVEYTIQPVEPLAIPFMPQRRNTLTSRPLSTSFRILTICDSLYRNFFMLLSVCLIVGRRTLMTHASILGDGYNIQVGKQ